MCGGSFQVVPGILKSHRHLMGGRWRERRAVRGQFSGIHRTAPHDKDPLWRKAGRSTLPGNTEWENRTLGLSFTISDPVLLSTWLRISYTPWTPRAASPSLFLSATPGSLLQALLNIFPRATQTKIYPEAWQMLIVFASLSPLSPHPKD